MVTSAVEGDTHITAYAPGIANWDKGKVFVTCRWVDANWEFPPPAAARAGSEHVFTTKIFRHTDRQPLAKYRVRYKILDGPAAIFKPSGTTEYTSVSDLEGNAQVAIAQLMPAFGTNRIGIEIIRPPDPTSPTGAGITIAKGETAIEWLAPNVTLTHAGPPSAVLGQDVVFATAINNSGRIESKSMTVTSAIPDGLQYLRAQPPAAVLDGKQLVWTLGTLPPGQTHQIQAVFKTLRPGPVTSCVALATEEGQKDEKCVTTQVTTASLRVTLTAPPTGMVGVPVTYQIAVTNPNNVPLADVTLKAQFDEGLEHEVARSDGDLAVGGGACAEFQERILGADAAPCRQVRHQSRGVRRQHQRPGNPRAYGWSAAAEPVHRWPADALPRSAGRLDGQSRQPRRFTRGQCRRA